MNDLKSTAKMALDWFKCNKDGSMSRNNADALADEVVEALEEALANDTTQERVAETGGKVHEAVAEPSGWRPATHYRKMLNFASGLPDEYTIEYWKLQGVEIEYCYTHPPELAATERQVEILTDEQSCSESLKVVDKAWAQFCGGIGRGPDAPYPGMIEAFELHYGQSFTDKDWRAETSVWAAAWKSAKSATQEPKQEQGEPVHQVYNDDGDFWEDVGNQSIRQGFEELGSKTRTLYTTPQQRKPMTDEKNVLVPLDILEAAESSLGAFCSDEGWGDEDMQNMDNLSAHIAQHKAAHGIKE